MSIRYKGQVVGGGLGNLDVEAGNLLFYGEDGMLADANVSADLLQQSVALLGAASTYERAELPTVNRISVTIHPTCVSINGRVYWSTIDKVLATDDVKEAGKDVYIYAVINDQNKLDFVLSKNSTVPNGYNANNSRKIGGFHCLCAAVGTIAGHTLSGYNAGDILPLSVWDLRHRPVSDPEGMVYIKAFDAWYDIYLASWSGTKLQSAFGATIADGTSARKYHGLRFIEDFGLVFKTLPSYDEFIVFAKGSNEKTAINGAADPNTTGGHKDTANRRMISNYGLEDCCGALWQRLSDSTENWCIKSENTVTPATWDGSKLYLNGYSFMTQPVYDSAVDGSTEAPYGTSYGLLRRLLAGGSWSFSTSCGSRCVTANSFGSHVSSRIGGRGRSKPLIYNT